MTPGSYMDWVKDSAFWQSIVVDDEAAFKNMLHQTSNVHALLSLRTFSNKASVLAVAAKNNSQLVTKCILAHPLHRNLINLVDSHGNTAVHEAVRMNSGAVFDMLLAAGADCSIANLAGKAPLHLACQLGYERMALALFRASPAVKDKVCEMGFTPLGYALHKLSAGEAKNAEEEQPLIKKLLAAGCVPSEVPDRGAEFGATAQMCQRALVFLTHMADVQIVTREGTPLQARRPGALIRDRGGVEAAFLTRLRKEQKETAAFVRRVKEQGLAGDGYCDIEKGSGSGSGSGGGGSSSDSDTSGTQSTVLSVEETAGTAKDDTTQLGKTNSVNSGWDDASVIAGAVDGSGVGGFADPLSASSLGALGLLALAQQAVKETGICDEGNAGGNREVPKSENEPHEPIKRNLSISALDMAVVKKSKGGTTERSEDAASPPSHGFEDVQHDREK